MTSEAKRWKPKAAETVARRVVETIVQQGLTAGDRLPREAEMVEEFGVSRETLREALRLLEAQRLIALRRGITERRASTSRACGSNVDLRSWRTTARLCGGSGHRRGRLRNHPDEFSAKA
jgi:GntR family transcriptional regulator, transcriptional repressor for pyruvate dehydrogenase complex